MVARDRLAAELKKSIESYQSEDIEKTPEGYILTSDHSRIRELQETFKDTLKSSVKIIPYLDNLKVAANVRKSIGDTGDESFLDIVAPVVTLGESQIDLLPEEVKLQRSIESQGKEIIKSGILAVIILVLICAWFFSKIYFKSSILGHLKTNYEKSREEAEILGRIAEKTGIVKDHLNNRLVTLDVINELYRIIPEEIYLSNVVIDENGTITIHGSSESMSRVFSMVSALEESNLFKNVKTTSTTAKRERGKDIAAFELTFKLESAKDDAETKDVKAAFEAKDEVKKGKE